MINQAITDLNELAALLDEVSAMVDELTPVPPPIDIVVSDIQVIFDVVPITEYDVPLPRRAKVISMFQNIISPKKFTSLRYCTDPATLTATINIDP